MNYEGVEQVTILFTAFLLEESGDENHVNSAAPTSKATLGLWHDVFIVS